MPPDMASILVLGLPPVDDVFDVATGNAIDRR